MTVQKQAVKHFSNIGMLFAGLFLLLQLIMLIPIDHKNPEWILYLMWFPLLPSFLAFYFAIKWVLK